MAGRFPLSARHAIHSQMSSSIMVLAAQHGKGSFDEEEGDEGEAPEEAQVGGRMEERHRVSLPRLKTQAEAPPLLSAAPPVTADTIAEHCSSPAVAGTGGSPLLLLPTVTSSAVAAGSRLPQQQASILWVSARPRTTAVEHHTVVLPRHAAPRLLTQRPA